MRERPETPPAASIGRFLLRDNVVTAEQLAAALRQQVIYGGRLGTNLFELGYADHDQIAQALAQLHAVPAALIRHIRGLDPRARELIPKSLCLTHCAMPLAFATAGGRRLVVCMRDPLDDRAVAHLADAANLEVIAAACPERTLYRLLAHYAGGALPARMSSPAAAGASPIPSGASGAFSAAISRDVADSSLLVATDAPMPTLSLVELDHVGARRDAAELASHQPLSLADLADDLKRRRAAETAAAALTDPTPALEVDERPPLFAPSESPRRRRAASSLSEALLAAAAENRIEDALSEPAEAGPPPLDRDSALSRIAAAEERSEVSSAVIGFLKNHFDAGVILVVQGEVAYGYRGFGGHFDETSVESILIPLQATSPFQVAYQDGRRYVGAGGGDDRSLFGRFLRLFPLARRPELCVVEPALVRDRVVCLIYAHSTVERPLRDAALDDLSILAAAVGEAFLRLIRSQRGE